MFSGSSLSVMTQLCQALSDAMQAAWVALRGFCLQLSKPLRLKRHASGELFLDRVAAVSEAAYSNPLCAPGPTIFLSLEFDARAIALFDLESALQRFWNLKIYAEFTSSLEARKVDEWKL